MDAMDRLTIDKDLFLRAVYEFGYLTGDQAREFFDMAVQYSSKDRNVGKLYECSNEPGGFGGTGPVRTSQNRVADCIYGNEDCPVCPTKTPK